AARSRTHGTQLESLNDTPAASVRRSCSELSMIVSSASRITAQLPAGRSRAASSTALVACRYTCSVIAGYSADRWTQVRCLACAGDGVGTTDTWLLLHAALARTIATTRLRLIARSRLECCWCGASGEESEGAEDSTIGRALRSWPAAAAATQAVTSAASTASCVSTSSPAVAWLAVRFTT